MAKPSSVPIPVVAFADWDALRDYVHAELCGLDHLDPAQTPILQKPLIRNRKNCGRIFHIEGPRLLRTSAIWTSDEARILFYNSQGLRVKEARLSEWPEEGSVC